MLLYSFNKNNNFILTTELFDVAVTLLSCIREVLGWKPGRGIGYTK
jgi:hypothetical protein